MDGSIAGWDWMLDDKSYPPLNYLVFKQRSEGILKEFVASESPSV